ncbi:MAG: alanine racemase [Aristaeellaceae bacterium]
MTVNVRHQVRSIDLAVLRNNVRLIRAQVPSTAKLMAVVKADAYGHGMVQVAREALAAGAEQLAIATVEEGVQLRQGGITAPVLMLGATSLAEAMEGVKHDLTLTVCTPDMVRFVQQAAQCHGRIGLVHLKLDTGMSRIGVRTEEELRAMLDTLAACPHVRMTGAFTHFADADGQDMTFTDAQFDRFMSLTRLLPKGILLHCCNSAAIHRKPEAALDMVRMGISMYGYPPVETDMPLKPVMDWRTEVTFVKTLRPGDKVSYNCTFTADKPITLATVACGYGDGYHRAAGPGAEVLIHGQRAKVVGRICMDQMMADVTHIPGVKAGDVVTLMGQDGSECITAEDIARWAGTISYEVLLAATGRVPREWLHAGC